nr:hypothetical protein [Mycobacterium colombiense]
MEADEVVAAAIAAGSEAVAIRADVTEPDDVFTEDRVSSSRVTI